MFPVFNLCSVKSVIFMHGGLRRPADPYDTAGDRRLEIVLLPPPQMYTNLCVSDEAMRTVQ